MSKQAFIDEYIELVRKHGMYIDAAGTLFVREDVEDVVSDIPFIEAELK